MMCAKQLSVDRAAWLEISWSYTRLNAIDNPSGARASQPKWAQVEVFKLGFDRSKIEAFQGKAQQEAHSLRMQPSLCSTLYEL